MVMRNVRLREKQVLTSFRKIAMASWRHPRDPSAYGSIDLPVEEALAFLKTYPSNTPLTLMHFVVAIIAHCLETHPELNHLLRRGNLFKRRQVDVFVTTLLRTPGGKDLSGFVIRDVPRIGIAGVAELCSQGIERLRHEEDHEAQRVQRMAACLPVFLLRPALLLLDFLQYTLNLSLGLPRDQFGSVTISDVGALGIDNAMIPLSPYSRCPLIVGVGKPRKTPVVRDGCVTAGTCMTISFTFDHRHADGAHAAVVMKRFKRIFTNPQGFLSIFAGKEPAQPSGNI